jgi:hypothetical protein
MKRVLLAIIAVMFFVSLAGAEQLDFTAPKQPTSDSTGINVRYIQIYPPPNQTIIVYFDWLDATGKKVWDSNLEISGQDFQDIMGFQIRSQDVGTPIGQGLKQLIWNKLEAFYGVTFQ